VDEVVEMQSESLRIAQVAPLFESVPPKSYGGTERVVSYLTEELVRQGHDVTLFASGDSVTAARLVSSCARSLRLDPDCLDPLPHHVLLAEQVFQRAHEFDVVHFHIEHVHLPLLRRHPVPSLTTMHGRLDIPDLVPLYREFPEAPVASISDAQKAPLPDLSWEGTVYHGLPPHLYDFRPGPGKYFVFLGRISPEKGVDRAVEIARRLDVPLKVAAKIGAQDRDYFEAAVKPLFQDPLVEFLGEIGDREKNDLLGDAIALLFPIDWPEPFGMVMIESLACGTPVVAFRRGAAPEVLEDGVTGFLVDTLEEAVAAAEKAVSLSRARCRQAFEERFTARRMAQDYISIYRRLIQRHAVLQARPIPILPPHPRALGGNGDDLHTASLR
jgi:glycosyltransferase involved in cell wall biosynthesis